MPRRPRFDPRLLGGLSPADFLAGHWQRRPLLIRDAVDEADLARLPDRSALAALAARDDVESRLVTRFAGRWAMTPGPIDRLPRRKRDWTLLVQGVNLHDAAADALMRRFDFVSAMRLDDLMISDAADGGGVGPHLDSYDVFLLQVDGRRRWRWRAVADDGAVDGQPAPALVAGAPLKLLADFVPTDEAVLEPGDMLYLPPSCAHDGVALGPCTTASIGFRAPGYTELTQEFLFAMAERSWPDGRLADAGRRPTDAPAALDDALLSAIGERLQAVRWTPDDVEAFVGRYFSEPKAHVYFDPPVRRRRRATFERDALRHGLALDRRTTMLYRGTRAYVVGEAFALPRASLGGFRRLADQRRLAAADVATLLEDSAAAALLYAWWSDGWIHCTNGEEHGAP